MPILWDEGGEVHSRYAQEAAFDGANYPQNWIIGSDGRIAYVANIYDPEAIRAVLDAELE
jgi:hypothetical protein